MKKQSFIIAILILVTYSWNTYAQNNEITISPFKNNMDSDGETYSFIHKDSKGNYIFKASTEKGIIVKKTDSKLNSTASYLLPKTDQTATGSFNNQGIYFIKDKIWMLRRFWEKKSDQITYKGQSLNQENLNPDGGWSPVFDFDYSKYHNPGFYSSKNNQSLMTTMRAKSDDKEADCVIKFTSYDANFKQLWSTDKKFPFKDNVASPLSGRIDDEGNFYMLFKVFRKHGKHMNVSRDDGKINFDLHMIVLTNKCENMLDYKLAFKTNIIPTSYSFWINTKGDLVVAGYYTTDIDNWRIENSDYVFDQKSYGSFYFNLDTKTNKIKSSSFDPFGKEILALDWKEKDVEKMNEKIKAGETGKVGFDYLNIHIAELQDDGSFYIIGQRSFTVMKGNDVRSYPEHYYQGIMLVQYDNTGKAAAKTFINKRQYSFNDGAIYLSFFFCKSKNNFYFYYNDSEENLTLNNIYKMKEFKPRTDAAHIGRIGNAEDKQIICLATVDKTGKLSKEKVLEDREKGQLLSKNLGVDFGDGNYILTTIGKDEDKSYLLKIADY